MFRFNFLNTLSAGVLSIAAVLSTTYGADEAPHGDAAGKSGQLAVHAGSDDGDDDTRSVMSAGSAATISASINFEPREITADATFDDLVDYITYLVSKVGEFRRASRHTQVEIKRYLVANVDLLNPVTNIEYRGGSRRLTLDRSIKRLLEIHQELNDLKQAAEKSAADAETALAVVKKEKSEAEKSAARWKTVAGVTAGAGVVVVAVILGNLDRIAAFLARLS
ncbi:MAG: hypothetical protein H6492_00220 [Candidatus Paracaedibacteraceae bacterium]|nr:hypothetical protein [Candidatus Paracaedibacteraceae bacterium]